MLPLKHLVLETRRSERSCMRLLGCKRVRCVMSAEGGSCLHSPTMAQNRIIISHTSLASKLGLMC